MSLQELNETVGKSNVKLLRVCKALAEIQYGAAMLGMTSLAANVSKQIDIINETCDELHSAMGPAIQEQFNRAEQSSSNILRTAIAVASISGKQGNDQ